MKILFLVQGEGRGHLTQAMTMERMLERHGHQVVEMLVGKSKSRKPPKFFEDGVHAKVEYFESVNFVASIDQKRPNMVKTVFRNLFQAFKFFPPVRMIRRRIKRSGADLIVNFYESLGSVAYRTTNRSIPMVCIAHQFLFLHKDMELPIRGYEEHVGLDIFSRAIARDCAGILALSFRDMPDDIEHDIKVVPPLLRPELLAFRGKDGQNSPEFKEGDYILGYMLNAGFADEVRKWHREHMDVKLHFFWDNKEHGDVYKEDETLTFYYLNDKEFLRQMAGCKAYASTAGFESICEAMYLGKPLMMVPSHIEQKCNAYDATRFHAAVSAEQFNLSVLENFAKTDFQPDEAFPDWANSAESMIINELERVASTYKRPQDDI